MLFNWTVKGDRVAVSGFIGYRGDNRPLDGLLVTANTDLVLRWRDEYFLNKIRIFIRASEAGAKRRH